MSFEDYIEYYSLLTPPVRRVGMVWAMEDYHSVFSFSQSVALLKFGLKPPP